ncbi:MAG: helix-hairpin-helix domain-containing protein [Bacteroidales bacterium]|nr:helix-hairpin-helix domain-containing protein [Bacteroidales bacterium]
MERREIEGRRLPEIVIAMTISFLLFSFLETDAQTLPEEVIQVIENMAENSPESAIEEYLEYFEKLLKHPLNINVADRGELEQIKLLTLFQIESIIEYRKEYGDILSYGELSVIDGFNPSIVERLAPFIVLLPGSGVKTSVGDKKTEIRQEYKSKVKSVIQNKGIYYYSKYIIEYKDRISAGLIIESDAGEKMTQYHLPDFTSFNVFYKGKKVLKNLILGDYVVRFGQGLVTWKSFPMSVPGYPASIMKKESGISPYSSTDESNFLRGAAATFLLSKYKISIFSSYNKLDARIEDSSYTSIITGGYHLGDAAINRRRSLGELLLGANASFESERWKFGLTAVTYGYDKHNARRVYEYNKYQMYDGMWGNLGIDFYTHIKNLRFFGELAIDMSPALAAILGVIWSPSYEFEGGILYRNYSKSYIATHAGAYSTLSNCSNQNGISVNLKYMFSSNMSLSFNSDYVYHPWLRYRIDSSSNVFKSKAKIDYLFNNGLSLYFHVSHLYGDSEASHKFGVRINIKKIIFNTITLGTRVDGTIITSGGKGYAIYQDITYKSKNRKIEGSLRGTFFKTSDWESRLYIYERDLPQSFSVSSYYGNGISAYAIIRYSPFRNMDFWIKCSHIKYFSQEKSPKTDLRLQINYSW